MRACKEADAAYRMAMTARGIEANRALAVAVLAAALGCSGQVGLEGDTGNGADSPEDADPDGVLDPDGTWPDATIDTSGDPAADTAVDGYCPAQVHWKVETRTIEHVTLADGTARLGTTQRLAVGVRMRSGCESLAGVRVDPVSGGATDFVNLLASAWVPVGLDCTPDAPIVERIVSLPGRGQGNLRVVVMDDSTLGGAIRLTYDREECPVTGCYCPLEAPPGTATSWADCTTDCSCAQGLSCVGYHGIGGPLYSCVRACSDDMDCMEGFGRCNPLVLDGAPWVCSGRASTCEELEPCPPGFDCVWSLEFGALCRDSRSAATGVICECDDDCPAGHMCVESASPEPICEIPCMSADHCPGMLADPMVCSSGWTCVYSD